MAKNYYEILGVSKTATQAEIKDKYPFTAPLIDQGIDRRKQQIMNELYNAALLDKPAT